MAHFARINETGTVTEVIVVGNEQLVDPITGAEVELRGRQFLARIGLTGTWVQTSYSGSLRGRFAGVGMRYDAEADEFVAPTEGDG